MFCGLCICFRVFSIVRLLVLGLVILANLLMCVYLRDNVFDLVGGLDYWLFFCFFHFVRKKDFVMSRVESVSQMNESSNQNLSTIITLYSIS